MPSPVSVIIPAYQEASGISATVNGVRRALPEAGILVVDDGSTDGTALAASEAGAETLVLPRNCGKGAALLAGFARARGEILVMLDGDLGASASLARPLIEPLLAGEADMTVAALPRVPGHRGGFGLVLKLAAWGLRRAAAPPMAAPLSGQRAMTRAAWRTIGGLDPRFGLEMGLNLDAARAGLRVLEVEIAFTHRLTGRNVAGFLHRGRQFLDVAAAIFRRSPGSRNRTKGSAAANA